MALQVLSRHRVSSHLFSIPRLFGKKDITSITVLISIKVITVTDIMIIIIIFITELIIITFSTKFKE